MALRNDLVYKILRRVTANVYYVTNEDDNTARTRLPYIVYQVVSKRPIAGDNQALIYKSEYQITLVTRKRSEALAKRLEAFLNEKELIPVLITSYKNEDYSMSRVYQVSTISKGGY